jgi:predicted transcriptional regulator
METKVINYGKLLQKYLKQNGISITHACKKLGIKRGTLYNRFNDGEFSYEELVRVKKFINVVQTINEN